MTQRTPLGRIASICKINLSVYGKDYQPRYRHGKGSLMKGAIAEARGICDLAQDILCEIKMIRKEARRRRTKP